MAFCWTGKIVREVKVTSEPAALVAVLTQTGYRFKRIGLEAGPLSQLLFSALGEAGLPVICVETRHVRAVLQDSPSWRAVCTVSKSSTSSHNGEYSG